MVTPLAGLFTPSASVTTAQAIRARYVGARVVAVRATGARPGANLAQAYRVPDVRADTIRAYGARISYE